jgi:UDP-N-acetylglucosamine--N-acetylmuramyl-(pentapeptide) pyrophosphoryl-undecaprenol N-acetylglucosamine transferase
MAEARVNILIAGGGTGGHLFPGIALARSFMSRNPENRVLFVGTDREFECTTLAREGFDHVSIRAAGIKGLGFFGKMKAAFKIPGALSQSKAIIKGFAPDIVIGVGGYSSGPVALAARLMGIPVVVQEQNILPGITNRIMGKFATRIHVSFEESIAFFNGKKAVMSGNPVRQSILDARKERDALKSGEQTYRFTLLVAGGSQGARAVNKAVMDALPFLSDKGNLFVIHQTGETDEKTVREAYEREGINADVKAFYTDMDEKYKAADLLVCRAGATTLSEITVMGLPSILIPFPYAADNHQVKNAMSLVAKEAAEMIEEKDLAGEMLAGRITYYRENPDELWRMEIASRNYGKPEAAETIVDDCYGIMKKGGEPLDG